MDTHKRQSGQMNEQCKQGKTVKSYLTFEKTKQKNNEWSLYFSHEHDNGLN